MPPRACPACKKTNQLQYKGFGTEHVEASIRAIIPDIRTLRVIETLQHIKIVMKPYLKNLKQEKLTY